MIANSKCLTILRPTDLNQSCSDYKLINVVTVKELLEGYNPKHVVYIIIGILIIFVLLTVTLLIKQYRQYCNCYKNNHKQQTQDKNTIENMKQEVESANNYFQYRTNIDVNTEISISTDSNISLNEAINDGDLNEVPMVFCADTKSKRAVLTQQHIMLPEQMKQICDAIKHNSKVNINNTKKEFNLKTNYEYPNTINTPNTINNQNISETIDKDSRRPYEFSLSIESNGNTENIKFTNFKEDEERAGYIMPTLSFRPEDVNEMYENAILNVTDCINTDV